MMLVPASDNGETDNGETDNGETDNGETDNGETGHQGEAGHPGGFGWEGGSGTTWRTDMANGLTGILLTQRRVMSPEPAQVVRDFWAAAYDAIDAWPQVRANQPARACLPPGYLATFEADY
jgi:hypothetical protein